MTPLCGVLPRSDPTRRGSNISLLGFLELFPFLDLLYSGATLLAVIDQGYSGLLLPPQ